MPKSSKEKNDSMFTPKTPHFYKIILEATIQEKKLGIPKKFVKKYGQGLSESVILTVPNGDTWHVELTKSDGVVWLENGWQEFVEYYSVKYGYFLVFKYEGNGKFQVVIFDMTASEIEYPCRSHTEDQKSDKQVCLKPVKEEAKDDTCNETLYETPPCNEKSDGQLSLKPVKKEAKGDTCNETLHETSPCKETKKKRSRSQSSNPRKKLKTTQKDKNEEDCEDFSSGEEYQPKKVPKCGRPYGAIEFEKALQRASTFKSENPYFQVTMQPYYIDPGRKMCIPKDFTLKYLNNKLGDVTLYTSDGKTWNARYLRYVNNGKYTKSLIHIGWKQFVLDNKLEAGDICIFELISQTEILLKVTIYRVHQDSSCCSAVGGKNCLENGGNASSSAPGSTNSDDDWSMRPMTPNEKALAILRANFRSRNPFFKVVMQPRYLAYRCSLSIPYKFVLRYLNEDKDEATLQVSNGRTWVVKFSVKVFNDGQYRAEFSHNWRAFAQDNDLKVGDVCVFELIDREENSFKVSIFSEAPGANSSRSRRADDSKARKAASKNCSVPRTEAEDDFEDGNCSPVAQLGYQENEEEVDKWMDDKM